MAPETEEGAELRLKTGYKIVDKEQQRRDREQAKLMREVKKMERVQWEPLSVCSYLCVLPKMQQRCFKDCSLAKTIHLMVIFR